MVFWGIYMLVVLSIIDCGFVFLFIEIFIIFFIGEENVFSFFFDCVIDKIICIYIFLLIV